MTHELSSPEVRDVVVVGSGAAGLTAALASARGGLHVSVLEKCELIGGVSAVSAGALWIPGLEGDDLALALRYMENQKSPTVDARTLGAILEYAPLMLKFVAEETGLQLQSAEGYPDYRSEVPGASVGRTVNPGLFDATILGTLADRVRKDGLLPYTRNELVTLLGAERQQLLPLLEERRDAGIVARGAALVSALLAQVLEYGVDVQTESGLRDLRRASNGNWAIETESGVRYEARSVVLATGGFEWDDSLRMRHFGSTIQATCSPPGVSSGDGLRIGMRLGACVEELGEAWWTPLVDAMGWWRFDSGARGPYTAESSAEGSVLLPGVFFRRERMGPGSITVDLRGCRVANESLDYDAFMRAVLASRPPGEQNPPPTFLVFDDRFRQRYGFLGREDGSVPGAASARTLQDAAERFGIDADALLSTVARFNDSARHGVDPDFSRGVSEYDRYFGDPDSGFPNPCLAPIEIPPFYVVPLRAGVLGTSGGLATNFEGKVLGLRREPIDGLYAVGNVSRQPFASGYPGAGATLGPAMTMAYIVGCTLSKSATCP